MDNVLFIDASKEFAPGKNQNKLRTEDISHIVDTYNKFAKDELAAGVVEDKYAYVATPAEIEENDYNLNIPRYVDTFEEEEESIFAVQKRLTPGKRAEGSTVEKMKEYLKELGY